MFSDFDFQMMRRALALAEKGAFTTTPNPRVGCVIVRDGEILGEGFHAIAGKAHAEVNALNAAAQAGKEVAGATVYVTLEPCCHYGRTPPCADALIRARVGRVVAATRDPNPKAARGGEHLLEAGIAFEYGLLEKEARWLNAGFFSRIERGRPWIRVKMASSLDGRTALANGKSQWITGEAARADGHAFRARACAILTGAGTVAADNPRLTVRGIDTPRQPLRVVLDSQATIAPDATLLNDGGKTLVVSAAARPASLKENVEWLALPATGANGHYSTEDLKTLAKKLGEREINELHVEAGAALDGALLEAGLVDELLIYVSPKILGDAGRGMFHLNTPLEDLERYGDFRIFDVARVGDDLRIRLKRD